MSQKENDTWNCRHCAAKSTTFLERMIAENPELEALITPLLDPREDRYDPDPTGEEGIQ